MNRLFLALNIPDSIKQEIIDFRNSIIPTFEEYKWEPPEKYHITLKFIGNVRDSSVQKFKEKLVFLENYKSFTCHYSKFGFFYADELPKILWLGLSIDNDIFTFVKKINNELSALYIKPERRNFRPHLTIMRVKKKLSQDFINSFESFKLPDTEFVADNISLIKSELHPAGSRYTEIHRYKLLDS